MVKKEMAAELKRVYLLRVEQLTKELSNDIVTKDSAEYQAKINELNNTLNNLRDLETRPNENAVTRIIRNLLKKLES